VWRIPLDAMEIDRFNLDPCSNEWSDVPSIDRIMPPADGLAWTWGLDAPVVWLNPPYSNVAPWFAKAFNAAGWGVSVWGVVPHAPNIQAWRDHGPDYAWSLGRVRFRPPPGVEESSPTQEHSLVLWSDSVDDLVISRIDSSGRTLYAMRRTLFP
jgi:hypothetical protein